ncbi:hypothetical protein NG895_20955 [Aeoliella sp. ICT_H6.2]|uniref:Uncharacterized protein n=1 Tax=Aeoliella straminimaris TaxID=2954799 RepID=A0A9X2JI09_9BACT|nr:hypothetical protein [Aeoliella straminimaris]MCO6046376.1 hypothetical protein [Aeoliella straminimaris]
MNKISLLQATFGVTVLTVAFAFFSAIASSQQINSDSAQSSESTQAIPGADQLRELKLDAPE